MSDSLTALTNSLLDRIAAAAELTGQRREALTAARLAADANFTAGVRFEQAERAVKLLGTVGKNDAELGAVSEAVRNLRAELEPLARAARADQSVSDRISFVDEMKFAGKRVLLRMDANVPIDDDGKITSDVRLREALPTIVHILKSGGRPIIPSNRA